MDMKSLITNAHVVTPNREIKDASVLIHDRKINAILPPNNNPPAVDCIHDAKGNYLIPGFIDIHAHGADGSDVCDGSTSALSHIAQKKLSEGVTTWLPTTLTQPRQKLLEIAECVQEFRSTQNLLKVPGLHMEGPFIHPEKMGAQNPQHLRQPSLTELKAIHSRCPVTLLSLAPCLSGAIELINEATKLGIHCSAAHTTANHAQLIAAKSSGMTHLTHFGNAMSALHQREIGAVGTGLMDPDLYLEIISDNVHLSLDFIQLVFKLKDISKILLITDSTASSWLPDGPSCLAGLPVEITNGIARLQDNQALAGSTLHFNQALKNTYHTTQLPLEQLIQTTSWNQARSLKLPHLGKIEVGFFADLVILNQNFDVLQTFVDGIPKL